MSSDRQELIRNAVEFLADSNTQASPLTQRIQFLEAKGLTPPEIELALKQASNAPINQSFAPPYGLNPYVMAHPLQQQWDWRDYFITFVLSGAVTYGAVSLFKKYVLPHLQPPTATAYEEDRDALNAQFDEAEALLKEIQNENAAIRKAVEEQQEKVDKTTQDIQNVITDMRVGEAKTRDEMREICEEINTIREMLPKMIEKNKESQTHSLGELQQELKSLKALLLTRAPSTPILPMPAPGRPTIPAWQLASAPPTSTGASALPTGSSLSSEDCVEGGNGKGKGKEMATIPIDAPFTFKS